MLLVHKEQIMATNDGESLKTAEMVQNATNLLLLPLQDPTKMFGHRCMRLRLVICKIA